MPSSFGLILGPLCARRRDDGGITTFRIVDKVLIVSLATEPFLRFY